MNLGSLVESGKEILRKTGGFVEDKARTAISSVLATAMLAYGAYHYIPRRPLEEVLIDAKTHNGLYVPEFERPNILFVMVDDWGQPVWKKKRLL